MEALQHLDPLTLARYILAGVLVLVGLANIYVGVYMLQCKLEKKKKEK